MLSAILPRHPPRYRTPIFVWNGVRKLSLFARIHAEPVMRTQELCRSCSNPWRLSSDRSRMTGYPKTEIQLFRNHVVLLHLEMRRVGTTIGSRNATSPRSTSADNLEAGTVRLCRT